MNCKMTIRNQYRGFFSLMSDVFYYAKQHLDNNDNLYVDISGHPYGYDNLFDRFFIQQALESYDRELFDDYPGANCFSYEITSGNYYTEEGIRIMQDLVPVFRRRFILKQEYLDKINLFYTENFQGNVFGIQKRGTDMYSAGHGSSCQEQADINNYRIVITNNLAYYDKCFLITDEQQSVDILKAEFNDRLITYPSIRSCNGQAIHGQFAGNPQIGEDILIETVLLSMCSKMFVTLSNISIFAIIYGNNFNYEFMDIGKRYIH